MEEKFNYAFLELDGETVNHLLEELPEAMAELEELYQMINKLSGEVHSRLQKIQHHVMACSTCLGRQMELGLLMPIEEYYKGPQGLQESLKDKFLSEMN